MTKFICDVTIKESSEAIPEPTPSIGFWSGHAVASLEKLIAAVDVAITELRRGESPPVSEIGYHFAIAMTHIGRSFEESLSKKLGKR